jgi:hypothetical protein
LKRISIAPNILSSSTNKNNSAGTFSSERLALLSLISLNSSNVSYSNNAQGEILVISSYFDQSNTN